MAPCDPTAPEAQALLTDLSAALRAITGSGGEASFRAEDMRGEGALFLLARDANGAPAGCGAIRPLAGRMAELKRMYAAPGQAGLGSALLSQLETEAARMGYRCLYLETRRVNQRAVRFYRRHGYRLTANFGRYAGRAEAVCFMKELSC